MLPSSPQLAPRPAGASHKETSSPPSIRVFFSFPCAKNPIHCPSGEKKGAYAPSVPVKRAALGWSSRRVKRRRVLSEPCETNTSRVPSGDRITAGPVADPSDTSGPRSRSSRTTGCGVVSTGRVNRHSAAPSAIATTASTPATAQGNRVLAAVWTGASSSSRQTSPMSRSRRFGSFSRQLRNNDRAFNGTRSQDGSERPNVSALIQTFAPEPAPAPCTPRSPGFHQPELVRSSASAKCPDSLPT